MLILSRNNNEEVRIRVGKVDIYVTVVGVNSEGRVRLGFDAPPEVKFLRYELTEEA